MDYLRKFYLNISIEPALFLYMFSSFLKYPVFQTLLYEKSCIHRYVDINCHNISHIYSDKHLQHDANHLYLLSSLTLMVPSLFSTLILGSLSDTWNVKVPMLIPFIALIISDFSYILQCTYMNWSPYYLLISDFIFGLCGGFTAIIGTMSSYAMKTTSSGFRSERMAAFEGSIGLGSTLGYAVSGILREAFGYAYVFLILMILHISAFFYILCLTKEINRNNYDINESENHRNWLNSVCGRLFDVISLFRDVRCPKKFRLLLIVLFAFSIELLVYSGISDILYSYLRLRLGWDDKEYGWFDGLGSGLNTVAVLALYPYLHYARNVSNSILTIIGLASKMLFLLILVFVWTDWVAYVAAVFSAFNRFISTGMRSLTAYYVTDGEQGKLFSLIALIESVTGIIASLIFNGLYPLTLDFFSGTMFIAVLVSLFIPLGFMIYVKRVENSVDEPVPTNNSIDDVMENNS